MNGPHGRAVSVHHNQRHHGDIIMSNVQRRDVLIGSALAAAAMAAVKPALAGDPSFMNNVPDPLLASDDLPTFKFALEKSEGKVIGGSYGKEATVKQLPSDRPRD
jgi:oxalate decarboxylase